MRITSSLLLAAGCVGLLALSVPAFSKPVPKAAEQRQKTQSQRADKNKKPADRTAKNKTNKTKAKKGAALEDRAARLRSTPIAQQPKRPAFGWPVLVSEARKYLGTNPTDRKRLWCATFMNMVLAKVGYTGTNSDAAKSFAQYGSRIFEPKVGAIAVFTRGKNGGHVGVVSGTDATGNPIVISGNHGRRVGEAIYPRGRVIAYVMPSEAQPRNVQVAETDTPNRSSGDIALASPMAEAPALASVIVPLPPMAPRRAVVPSSAAPRRVAQKMPASSAQPRYTTRDLPLDPALANLLGIKEAGRPRAKL